MTLDTPVSKLFMVGPTYARRLKKLGIETVENLINHFPFRYDDYSLVSKIGRVQPGEKITLQGEVLSIKNEYTKYGKKIQKAKIADETGEVEITWFNQPFLVRVIKVGEKYSFSGKADLFGHKVVLLNPEYEKLKPPNIKYQIPNTIHTGRLVPVYPETRGVSSKWIRSRIAPVLNQLKSDLREYLPVSILLKHKMMPYREAILKIHFPENRAAAQKARERLAFDELFLIQSAAQQRKKTWQKNKLACQIAIDQEKILSFLSQLPFELTGAQKRCVKEILTDLGKKTVMNRLLQGDVGSGKTVVAAVAIYAAFSNGYQAALMAPTEILAFQHYQTIKTMLKPFGVKIALQTRSIKFDKLDQLDKFDIVVGTHALLGEKLTFSKLGLVVIDEQHRFGVEQRARLIKKSGVPHVLTMSATPIPRTITLTLYGDLDLSFLDEMPPGRQEVKTWVVSQQKRQAALKWIEKEIINESSQAFIIYPLIEESQNETMKDVRAATAEYERLQKVFPRLNLGLLHGRLKTKEKESVLADFKEGKIHILVSTPVVEVGIDVPNATIMMVEGADRFGLAQLHQLRGRVGRGSKKSYCFLFSQSKSKKVISRLSAMEKIQVGIKLAELDLKMRGPGDIYGLRQHGFPDFKLASFADLELIEKTRQASVEAIANIAKLSKLQDKLKQYTIRDIEPN